jgi:hypothetical protein
MVFDIDLIVVHFFKLITNYCGATAIVTKGEYPPMNDQAIISLLLFILSMLCLGIGIYAFYRYSETKSERLFAFGMSLVITAGGIMCGSLDQAHLLPLNFGWAWYAGSSSGYFLIFMSSILTSTEQFRNLKRWSLILAVLLITVLVLTPLLPAFPNIYVPVSLNILRTVICALGLLCYLRLYTSKGTRFSFLMLFTFLFLTVGFAILTPQLLDPTLSQLAIAGAVIRILGVGGLFTAFVTG